MYRKKGRIMNKEYIIEVENADTDTLDTITEALNTFNVRCYVYEKEEEKQTIKITVEGGVVVDVENLPLNFNYEIRDKDE
jgi:archaellum component FlaF (FlaF/FlaG flagellin family)